MAWGGDGGRTCSRERFICSFSSSSYSRPHLLLCLFLPVAPARPILRSCDIGARQELGLGEGGRTNVWNSLGSHHLADGVQRLRRCADIPAHAPNILPARVPECEREWRRRSDARSTQRVVMPRVRASEGRCWRGSAATMTPPCVASSADDTLSPAPLIVRTSPPPLSIDE